MSIDTTYSPLKRNQDVDEYLTPPELITACMALTTRHFKSDQSITVLDVGCNTGQWGSAARKLYPNAYIVGVDIMDVSLNSAYNLWIPNQNFLTWASRIKYFDLIVGNVPYSNYVTKNGKRTRKSVAEKIVTRALGMLNPQCGFQYILLRSAFRHSRQRLWADGKKRTKPGLHQVTHYKECHALIPRPSFYVYDTRETAHCGHARTNLHDYDLFVWDALWKERYGFSYELDWEYNNGPQLVTSAHSA